MVDTSGTCGWMEHGSLDESHTGIVGGGPREDMTSGWPGSWISPHVLGMFVWPTVPIAGAGSTTWPRESQVLLRPSGVYSWLNPGKALYRYLRFWRTGAMSQPLEGDPVCVSLLIKPATYLWGMGWGRGKGGVCFFLSTLPVLCVQGPVCEPAATLPWGYEEEMLDDRNSFLLWKWFLHMLNIAAKWGKWGLEAGWRSGTLPPLPQSLTWGVCSDTRESDVRIQSLVLFQCQSKRKSYFPRSPCTFNTPL